MSKTISKEMWKKIEEEMSGGWVAIAFSYKGHEVSVSRVRESESKTSLQIYIDGFIQGEWIKFDGGFHFSESAPKIIGEVWCRKSKSKYSPSRKKQLQEIYGKRRFKQRFPDADDKYFFYVPDFSKASVLCRQYKKLEGIELVKADCMGDE